MVSMHGATALNLATQTPAPASQLARSSEGQDKRELRETFDQFVGETFYGQMLASMRKSLGKPAYFHGGRAEEVFTGQLDQTLAQEMTKASAEKFTGPMFELFSLTRK